MNSAKEVARGELREPAGIADASLLTAATEAPDLELPVFRIRFADAHATDVFVDPSTGPCASSRRWRSEWW